MIKTSKEIIRLLFIAASTFLALVGITYASHTFLPTNIAKIILIPFYLLWLVVLVAFWGIGPLAKRLTKTAIEEAKGKNNIAIKQPWEQ